MASASPARITRTRPPGWAMTVAVRSLDCELLDFGAPAPIACFRTTYAKKP